MVESHSHAAAHTPPHPSSHPVPPSRKWRWIGGWIALSIVWVIGSWLYFFTFTTFKSSSPYAPLSGEEKACIARYSDKERQKSCRDLVGIQTQGDIAGQYFTRVMFVFIPPVLLGFVLWLKLQSDKDRTMPVGRPQHLMTENGGYSPMMEEAIAEHEAKRARENMPSNLAAMFGKDDQRPRR
jgi:hypothetical protein